MTTKMTNHGISTTTRPGQEQYEEYYNGRQFMVQYDYRDMNGKLFSCVARTLELARAKRDAWLAKVEPVEQGRVRS